MSICRPQKNDVLFPELYTSEEHTLFLCGGKQNTFSMLLRLPVEKDSQRQDAVTVHAKMQAQAFMKEPAVAYLCQLQDTGIHHILTSQVC